MDDRTTVVFRISDQLTGLFPQPITGAQRILDYLLKSTLARECLRNLIHEKDVAEFTCEGDMSVGIRIHVEEALQRVDAIRGALEDYRGMAANMPDSMEPADVALLWSASSDLYEVLHRLMAKKKG